MLQMGKQVPQCEAAHPATLCFSPRTFWAVGPSPLALLQPMSFSAFAPRALLLSSVRRQAGISTWKWAGPFELGLVTGLWPWWKLQDPLAWRDGKERGLAAHTEALECLHPHWPTAWVCPTVAPAASLETEPGSLCLVEALIASLLTGRLTSRWWSEDRDFRGPKLASSRFPVSQPFLAPATPPSPCPVQKKGPGFPRRTSDLSPCPDLPSVACHQKAGTQRSGWRVRS